MNNDARVYRAVNNVERVEFPCQCGHGVYRYTASDEHTASHQLPHRCQQCNDLVYFAIPYPALRYKGRLFVDWETIKSS